MLLYVLPFVILLVVALILKKREASQDAEPSKKSTAPKNKAKTGSTASSEVSNTQTLTAAPLSAAERSELAPELRRHIENQMRDGNYFAAEAQINQALNRDNGQHELYLMLLDLHLLQNDEFAINQLFTHLRSLQLDDILQQAQSKRDAHEQKLAQDAKNKAEAQAAQLAANSVSFEQLQEQVTTPQAPLEFKQTEVAAAQPLEFTASANKPETAEPKPLEFNSTNTANPTAEVKAEAKPLDFAFNLEQPASAVPLATATAAVKSNPTADNSLDFSFSPSNAPAASAKPELEFNLDQAPAPAKKSLDFDFVAPQAEPAKAAPPATELEFKLEQPAAKAQQPLEFSLETPVAKATPAVQAQVQLPKAQTAAAKVVAPTQPNANDPLLQLFPTLGQVNEAELNLRLASEYIRLGAYQEAKALLQEQEAEYNEQQRQIASALRNKIA